MAEKKLTPEQLQRACQLVYGKPKKKRKKRFKRKVDDAKIRPKMIWENRKTKSEQ